MTYYYDDLLLDHTDTISGTVAHPDGGSDISWTALRYYAGDDVYQLRINFTKGDTRNAEDNDAGEAQPFVTRVLSALGKKYEDWTADSISKYWFERYISRQLILSEGEDGFNFVTEVVTKAHENLHTQQNQRVGGAFLPIFDIAMIEKAVFQWGFSLHSWKHLRQTRTEMSYENAGANYDGEYRGTVRDRCGNPTSWTITPKGGCFRLEMTLAKMDIKNTTDVSASDVQTFITYLTNPLRKVYSAWEELNFEERVGPEIDKQLKPSQDMRKSVEGMITDAMSDFHTRMNERPKGFVREVVDISTIETGRSRYSSSILRN
uniref:Uncharacterized protein n=1 Tax=Kwoniella bestiolae CBS 10118 TaxID=1296100 RepID=A0A1B9GFN1_9TREE|nr:hypothetical protein I302_01342 [Kwoniella bestiolae CBS 10118]OCF29829.1 hypothetical protein I302_01342 [Kwoniella bestiolae CBS 10118]